MTDQFFPSYTIGADAYDSVPSICGAFGKTAVIIGGQKRRNRPFAKPVKGSSTSSALSSTATTAPLKRQKR